jgi:Uma2 family endonuclease
MTTQVRTATPPSTSDNGLVPYSLTVRQFLKMIEAGVFPERPRVELIEGMLVERMTKYTPHNFAVDSLAVALRRLVEPDHLVREEKSLVIGRRSRPEPDIAVVRGPRGSYRSRDPDAPVAVSVIEVADSTYAKDRGPMWRLYAGAGIPAFWIVNIRQRRVEVYTNPAGRGKTARYRDAATFGPGDEVPVVIGGREAGRVAVDEILP